MWWDHQNLDKPRRDKAEKRWNFRVWHDVVRIHGRFQSVARVFFWDDQRQLCGVRIFQPGDDTHVTALKDFMEKLVASARLREKYQRALDFPLERHYSAYGAFPDESSS